MFVVGRDKQAFVMSFGLLLNTEQLNVGVHAVSRSFQQQSLFFSKQVLSDKDKHGLAYLLTCFCFRHISSSMSCTKMDFTADFTVFASPCAEYFFIKYPFH